MEGKEIFLETLPKSMTNFGTGVASVTMKQRDCMLPRRRRTTTNIFQRKVTMSKLDKNKNDKNKNNKNKK